MTLVNRVSLFFLLALGVGLAGYSAVMYVLIRDHLFHEFDGQLGSALNVLVAAVEVEPEEVKWQPSDHTITLGNENEKEEVRWLIVNEQGTLVDSSHNLRPPHESERELLRQLAWNRRNSGADLQSCLSANGWRWRQQLLVCNTPKPIAEREFDEFEQLMVVVGRQTTQLQAELWRLALLACILPSALWTGAAFAGRAYCRRALRPVGEMATRARSMTNADFNLRLPVSPQQDELSSLAIAFNHLLDRLQQAYHQQQRFTGDAAHQLRTPLTILRGQIDVALRRARESHEYQETLLLINEEFENLQQIVESLLFLARTEGDSPPDQQTLHLETWLTKFLLHWQTHPRANDLQVEFDGDAAIIASPSLLRQALDNLIDNAFNYSSPESAVVIRVETGPRTLRLSVEDHGTGVPETEWEAIFEPFYRNPQARQKGVSGTGLGLSIVARIVQLHGGQIHCEANVPTGTRIVMTLPLAENTNENIVRNREAMQFTKNQG